MKTKPDPQWSQTRLSASAKACDGFTDAELLAFGDERQRRYLGGGVMSAKMKFDPARMLRERQFSNKQRNDKKERAARGISMLGAAENLLEIYSAEVGGDNDKVSHKIIKVIHSEQQRLLSIYDANDYITLE